MQSAALLSALIVSNDAFNDYCPRHVEAKAERDGTPAEMVALELAPGDSHLVTRMEWEWGASHAYRSTRPLVFASLLGGTPAEPLERDTQSPPRDERGTDG